MKSFQSEVKQGQFRPRFESPYTVKKSERIAQKDRLRLGDLLLCVVPIGDEDFYTSPDIAEFEVVDLERIEKGFFSVPPGPSTPEYITGLIESHFDSPAVRLGQTLWAV